MHGKRFCIFNEPWVPLGAFKRIEVDLDVLSEERFHEDRWVDGIRQEIWNALEGDTEARDVFGHLHFFTKTVRYIHST